MYTLLNTNQITDQLMTFNVFGQSETSYECCEALAEWLEWYEEETEQSIELDPIALRCEWSCYTISEAEETWCIDTEDAETLTDVKLTVLDYLTDHTQVISVNDDLYLVQEF